jgi:hypothetical protein
MSDVKIQGIDLDDVQKFDTLGEGVVIIKMRDGSELEFSLDEGELSLLQEHLGRREESIQEIVPVQETVLEPVQETSDAVENSGDGEPVKFDLPKLDSRILDRATNNWMEIEFTDPNLCGYWPVLDDLPFYLQRGYVHATYDMVKAEYHHFFGASPGEGSSPNEKNRLPMVNGHYLLVCSKETQEKLHNHYINNRRRPEDNRYFMSKAERKAAGVS